MKCICEYCKIEFETKKFKKNCCFSHAALLRWQDPAYVEKRRIITTDKWKDPSFRDKVINRLNDEDVKKQKNDTLKKSLSNPLIKKKYSESKKKMWENEEYRKNNIQQNLNRWENEEYRKNISYKMSVHWSNIDFANNHMKTYYKKTSFTLPSGKIIFLQGYEHIVLKELLKKFSEEDLIIGNTEIKKAVGNITYDFNNSLHNYYPDMYIKSINTIIEVKSTWTYEKRLEENIKKMEACVNKGLNFKFIIMKNKNDIKSISI